MPQKRKTDLRQTIAGLAAGGAIAVGISLGGMILLGVLVSRGLLGEAWILRGAPVSGAAGCLLGGGYAILAVRSRPLLTGIGTSLIFLVIWLVFGWIVPLKTGEEGWMLTALGALAGGMLSGVLRAAGKKPRK